MDCTAGDEGVGSANSLSERHSAPRYDELFTPTTAGACGAAAPKHETSPMDCTAGDEGVGSANSLSECNSTRPFSTTFRKRAAR